MKIKNTSTFSPLLNNTKQGEQYNKTQFKRYNSQNTPFTKLKNQVNKLEVQLKDIALIIIQQN